MMKIYISFITICTLILLFNSCQDDGQSTELSTDTSLKCILVNNDTLQGFNPEQAAYIVNLPHSLNEMPMVSAISKSPNATISISEIEEIPGKAYIRVTAQNTSVYKDYTIAFVKNDPGVNAKLAEIVINDTVFIEGFRPDSFYYHIDIKFDTILPIISARNVDPYAIHGIQQVTTMPQKTFIVTGAEDWSYTEKYDLSLAWQHSDTERANNLCENTWIFEKSIKDIQESNELDKGILYNFYKSNSYYTYLVEEPTYIPDVWIFNKTEDSIVFRGARERYKIDSLSLEKMILTQEIDDTLYEYHYIPYVPED